MSDSKALSEQARRLLRDVPDADNLARRVVRIIQSGPDTEHTQILRVIITADSLDWEGVREALKDARLGYFQPQASAIMFLLQRGVVPTEKAIAGRLAQIAEHRAAKAQTAIPAQ